MGDLRAAIEPTIGQKIAWMVAVPTALATSVKLIASAYCEDISGSEACENENTPTTTKLMSRNVRGSCYVVILLITMICAISLGQSCNVTHAVDRAAFDHLQRNAGIVGPQTEEL